MELYQRIKLRREQLGLSQEELAKKMNYKSRSSINKIEIGKNDIPQSKIVSFAEALDTSPAYLMGWEKEAPPAQTAEDALKQQIFDIINQLPPAAYPRAQKILEAAFEVHATPPQK